MSKEEIGALKWAAESAKVTGYREMARVLLGIRRRLIAHNGLATNVSAVLDAWHRGDPIDAALANLQTAMAFADSCSPSLSNSTARVLKDDAESSMIVVP